MPSIPCQHKQLNLDYVYSGSTILYVYLCEPCGYYLETQMPALDEGFYVEDEEETVNA
jgi:hypothetical protein